MRILLIDGHPDENRLSAHLLDHYAGQCPSHAKIDRLAIRDIAFDPILKKGYAVRQPWEPDLIEAARLIDACDHIVFAFPMWWGAEPALVKGFLDRILVPHFAFRYRETGQLWDRLLAGRSADALVTMDTPSIFLRFVYHNAIVHRWRGQIFDFCGFKPARFEVFATVRKGKAATLLPKWLKRVAKLARSVPAAQGDKKSSLEAFLAYGSNRLESP